MITWLKQQKSVLWNQPIVLAFRNCKFRKSESIDPNVKIAAVIVVVSIIIGGFASYGLAVHFGELWPEPIHNILRWVSLLTAFNFVQIKKFGKRGRASRTIRI